MFDFNSLNTPEPFKMYLCQPNGSVLYELNGIEESTASITLNLNNQSELSFDYMRYINSSDNTLVESNGYHDFVIGMKILVDKIGYFKIKYPPIKYDGNKESKTITANSVDCELEDKDLVGFKINTGEEDSLEYLVTYDNGETETLINEYTGLPYDYIVFYNTYASQLQTIKNKYSNGTYTSSSAITEIKKFCDLIPRLKRKAVKDSEGNLSITEYVEYTYDSSGENVTKVYLSGFNTRVNQLITFYEKYHNQLSLIELAIEKCSCNWTIGEVDESLCNKKFQFNIDGQNIYSFLTTNISQVVKCVFEFDLFRKKINVRLAENIGDQTGVIIDKYNLLNNSQISCNSDSIYTRYNVSGGNNIDIKYVNFGRTRIDDISYFLNARDEHNRRIYVSDELAEKYDRFDKDRDIARTKYIELTKQYNQYLIDIDELKYRVPLDSLSNDWDTFSDTELEAMYRTYNQLLATLSSLYKEDYAKSGGVNSDGSIKESYIKNTPYWYDYYGYKNTIEQISAALEAYGRDEKYKEIDSAYTLSIINAYKTEWTLYGTVELENKIASYNNQMKVLVDGGGVYINANTGVPLTWSQLSNSQKQEYGFYEANYKYSTYKSIYDTRNSCQSYLDTLNTKLNTLVSNRDAVQRSRTELIDLVTIEKYNRTRLAQIVSLPSSSVGNSFTNDEIATINLLYVDKNYSNENILTTSLDTVVSTVDVEYELLEDAKEQLSIESQPQVTFSAEVENLLCMKEFESYDFSVGNYVTLQYYDNYYVDMRIKSMSFNPCVPESSFAVTFTNFIKSNSERSDITNILGLATGNGNSSSGGSSGSGSGKNFGDSDKIDVTISNTMLSKLLNTEMFGTRVSDVVLDTIKVNEITAKYAKFDGLAKGTTIIDGSCIQTGCIFDKNYKNWATNYNSGKIGVVINTSGSILNLETGYFNFGGGKIKFDGTGLTVTGNLQADSGYIGGTNGFTITSGKLYSGLHSAYNSNNAGVYVGTDYIALGSGGKVYFKNDGTFSLGGSTGITFNGSTVTFGTGVTLKWNNISDVPTDLAHTGDIPTDVSQLSDSQHQKWSTEIGNTWIKTANVTAQNLTVYAANIQGTLVASSVQAGNNFTVDSLGNMVALSGKIGYWNITSTYITTDNYIGTYNKIYTYIENRGLFYWRYNMRTSKYTPVGGYGYTSLDIQSGDLENLSGNIGITLDYSGFSAGIWAKSTESESSYTSKLLYINAGKQVSGFKGRSDAVNFYCSVDFNNWVVYNCYFDIKTCGGNGCAGTYNDPWYLYFKDIYGETRALTIIGGLIYKIG